MSDKEASKQKILLAAMKEFAEYGYEKASTNHIVENCGLSKGLIFHHYGNKHNLFLICCERAMDIYNDSVEKEFTQNSVDILQCILNSSVFKLRMYKKEPIASKLLIQMFVAISDGIIPEINEKYSIFIQNWKNKIFDNSDESVLRDDFTASDIENYILLIIETYANRFLSKYNNNYIEAAEHLDEFITEIEKIQTLVKSGTYKKD